MTIAEIDHDIYGPGETGTRKALEELVKSELVSRNAETYCVNNFAERQGRVDDSRDRVRRFRLREVGMTEQSWEDLIASQGGRCAHCPETEGLTIDHIHPKSRGGGNSPENIQALCKGCNCKKSASMPRTPRSGVTGYENGVTRSGVTENKSGVTSGETPRDRDRDIDIDIDIDFPESPDGDSPPAMVRSPREAVEVPEVDFGPDEADVRLVIANDAAENRDGKIAASRVRGLRHRIFKAREKHGVEAFRHGLRVAIGAGKPTAYACGTASKYKPEEALGAGGKSYGVAANGARRVGGRVPFALERPYEE